MKHTAPALTLWLLAFLLPCAAAFQLGGQSEPPLSELYPGPLANADFGEVLAGELTGDLQLDAVVMDGTEPKLAVAPEIFDSAVGTGLSASAIAILPGVIAGKDLLLVADAEGLKLLERDSAQGQWLVTSLFDAQSGWAGAVALAVGDLDGQGGLDIVAVRADGHEVRLAYGAGDGTFTEGAPIALVGPPSYRLRLLNWREAGDVPGTDEIALISNLGAAVFEPDGTLLSSFAGGAPNTRAAVIDDAGTSVQRLAVIAVVNGNDFLRILGASGASGLASLGPAGVVSMSSGDVDDDGDTELFLSVTSERKVWMLLNRSPATPTFDVSAVQKFAYGPALRDPAWNQAGLAVRDFDSDGRIDVLAPAQGGSVPAGGAWVDVPSTLPLVHVGSGYQAQLRVGVSGVFYNTVQPSLFVTLTAPSSPITTSPGVEIKLKTNVWHTPGLGEPTNPTAIVTRYDPLPNPELGILFDVLPPGYSPEDSPDVFSFVFRQVAIVDGVVVQQGPALSAIVVSEAYRSVVEEAADTEVFIATSIGPDSVPPQGGMGIGPTVPPPEDGQEPGEGNP